jgi:hypothetical protein
MGKTIEGFITIDTELYLKGVVNWKRPKLNLFHSKDVTAILN